MSSFPDYRPRRLRANPILRSMVRETRLSVEQLILPLFVCPGRKVDNPVPSMPGVSQLSVDLMVEKAKGARDLGIPAVLLFGIPEEKDEVGSGAYDENGIVQRAVRALKEQVRDLTVITDVCLCEYTDHGHCGVIVDEDVDNDATLDLLAKEALSHAEAGADIVAPSDMMDGRVGSIREALDDEGFSNVPIMSYAVKYASGFYSPFRDAADSAPEFGDRRSYQMDPANSEEAMREAQLDIDEGADILIVKPALSYLDVLWRVKENFGYPVAAYNVSGEYSMIKAAAQNGWISEERIMMETLTSIRRAGADMIITYFAEAAAKKLRG